MKELSNVLFIYFGIIDDCLSQSLISLWWVKRDQIVQMRNEKQNTIYLSVDGGCVYEWISE